MVQQIIKDRNVFLLRAFLEERFKVGFNHSFVAYLMELAFEWALQKFDAYHSFGYIDDDTWAMWFNNRIREHGYCWLFQGRGIGPQDLDEWSGATLHCFFIGLEETEEMLRLLGSREKIDLGIARSKIARTPLKVINPIDRTAAVVTGISAKPPEGDL